MKVDSSAGAAPQRPVVVRLANRGDVPAIAALWNEMMQFHGAADSRFRFSPGSDREYAAHVRSAIGSRSMCVVVAEVDRLPVGFAMGELHRRPDYYPMGSYGFISDLSVTSRWRRLGIGRALVERLREWFLGEGITAIELFQAQANPVSAAFWSAMGFNEYLRLLRCELRVP